MVWATASLVLAVTAVTASTAEVASMATQAAAAAAVSESVLWSFGASGDGGVPLAALIVDKWGNPYGTTAEGGAIGAGTAFELTPPARQHPQWSESVLWSFFRLRNRLEKRRFRALRPSEAGILARNGLHP
jgi:hypothetical protein